MSVLHFNIYIICIIKLSNFLSSYYHVKHIFINYFLNQFQFRYCLFHYDILIKILLIDLFWFFKVLKQYIYVLLYFLIL